MKIKSLSKKIVCLVAIATTISNFTAYAGEINKEETVYVILDENGKPTSNIVSDKISSDKVLGEFTDKSSLSNIKNIKSDEIAEVNGETLKWNVDSEELYYEGTSEKELPLSIEIKYEFNNKEVNPKDVLGKKGSFKIIIKIKNDKYETKKINGEDRKIYLPILTATECILPNDVFSNIKVNSGKIIDDGSNSMVTLISAPGLEESLNLNGLINKINSSNTFLESQLDNSIEIAGNTSDFQVPYIALVGTVIDEELTELDEVKSFEEIKDKLNQLEKGGEELLKGQKELQENYVLFDEGVEQATAGSTELNNGLAQLNEKVPTIKSGMLELRNGINQLHDKSPELVQGIKEMSEGATELNNGIAEINNKAPELYNGTTELNGGLNELQSKIPGLEGGIAAVDDGINTINSNMQTLAIGATDLNEGLATLNASESTFTEGINQFVGSIKSLRDGYNQIDFGIKAARDGVSQLKGGLNEGGNNIEQLRNSTDDIDNLNVGINQVYEAIKDSNPEAAEELLNISNSLGAVSAGQRAGIDEIINKSQEASLAAEQLEGALAQVTDGSNAFMENFDALVNGGDNINTSALQIKEGVSSLYTGSNDLLSGANALSAGTSELVQGSSSLRSASGELETGVNRLAEGSSKLVEGTSTLKEGVSRLSQGSNKLSEGGKTLEFASNELSSGVEALAKGSNELAEGGSVLSDAVGKLAEGSSELADGTITLRDKSKQVLEATGKLVDGTTKIKEEGLDQISNLGNDALDSIDELKEVKNELVKMADNYGLYSGINENMTGNVKFIMRTEAMKVEEKKDSKAEGAKEAKEDKEDSEGLFSKLLAKLKNIIGK